MARPHFIGVDWGTSNFRAYLVGSGGGVLAHAENQRGILAVEERDFSTVLRTAVGPWMAQHGPLPVMMSGMIGSRQGWVEAPYVRCPAGVREMPPEARADAAASVRRDTIPMLIAASEGRLAVRVVSGAGAERVLEISGKDFDPVRLHIDDKMLIARQEFTTAGPGGQRARAEESFSDYRVVSGIQVPFQAAVHRDGRVVVTRTITKVVINEKIDPALFARPK